VTFDELHGHARTVEQSVYDTGRQRKCGIKADRNFPHPITSPVQSITLAGNKCKPNWSIDSGRPVINNNAYVPRTTPAAWRQTAGYCDAIGPRTRGPRSLTAGQTQTRAYLDFRGRRRVFQSQDRNQKFIWGMGCFLLTLRVPSFPFPSLSPPQSGPSNPPKGFGERC